MQRRNTLITARQRPMRSALGLGEKLEADRLGPEGADRDGLRRDLRTIERAFRETADRGQRLVSDPRLTQPTLGPLAQRALQASDTSRLLACELLRAESDSETVFPAASLEALLKFYSEQLDRLEDQLWLLESLSGYAVKLKASLDALCQNVSVPPGRFQSLTRRIQLDVCRSPALGFLMLEEGIRLSDYLASENDLPDATVFADSIETARVVAWAANSHPGWHDRRELLTLAGLLSDCGILPLLQTASCTTENLAVEQPESFRKHPIIGAGIVAGVEEYSIDLAFLVAQHHERLDGTGYPRQLGSLDLSSASRFLAVASRFVELLHEPVHRRKEIAATQQIQSHSHRAAELLYREAEQGELDLNLAVLLLNGLDFFSKADHDSANSQQIRLAIDENSEDRKRFDRAHSESEKRPAEEVSIPLPSQIPKARSA